MMIKDAGPIKAYHLHMKDIYSFVCSIYFMSII